MLFVSDDVRTPSDEVALIAEAIVDVGGRPPSIGSLSINPVMSAAIDDVLDNFNELELRELHRAKQHPSAAQRRLIMQRVLEFRLSRTERELSRVKRKARAMSDAHAAVNVRQPRFPGGSS